MRRFRVEHHRRPRLEIVESRHAKDEPRGFELQRIERHGAILPPPSGRRSSNERFTA
jgi:hypothetical protein